MKFHKQTKLTAQLEIVGDDKLQKQTFQNVIENPDGASVKALGQVMASFDPENTSVASVIETVEYEHVN